MATTVVLTDVILGPPVRVKFSDGTEFEFSSVDELNNWVDAMDDPDQEGSDNARRMCIAYLRKRSATYSQLNSVKDKNFIFDLGHAQVIRVQ